MVFLSAACVSIPDILHHRAALIGHSGRLGNTLIVSHTSVIYATLPAVCIYYKPCSEAPDKDKRENCKAA